MRLPRGAVPALLAAGLLLAAAAGGARADPPPTTTTVPALGTTTSETTTAAATTTAPTTTVAATTTSTTAAATTTATLRRRKALVRRSRAVAGAVGGATYADRGCFVAAVALVLPGRAPFVLGPVAEAPSSLAADISRLAYPTDGSIVTAGAVDLQEVGCGAAQRAHGTARVEGLSLFRGAVEATAVSTRFTSLRQASAIGGLRISGRAAHVRAGTAAPVGDWGSVSTDARLRLAGDSRLRASGLSVHLLKEHAGLPAGADVLVAFAALPAPAAEPAAASAAPHPRHRRHTKPRPLTVTPPLGLTGYVFPIAGAASFGDSYGGFRSDVAGNWHHGDDLFAALGTPVVAVASGTLNRVGWESVGGWRLWVRDDLGNEFYYAHLSGYAPDALHSKHVRAGEVIGFVGNSGDAFTTPPHVHFEIHPRRFLHLHYNGAVDPTTYLEHWPRLAHVHAPRPVHPRLPAGAARIEAKYVFRELLASRHLIAHAPPPPLPRSPLSPAPVPAMPAPLPTAAQPASAAARAHGGLSPWELVLVALLAALPVAALAGPIARAVQRRIVSA